MPCQGRVRYRGKCTAYGRMPLEIRYPLGIFTRRVEVRAKRPSIYMRRDLQEHCTGKEEEKDVRNVSGHGWSGRSGGPWLGIVPQWETRKVQSKCTSLCTQEALLFVCTLSFDSCVLLTLTRLKRLLGSRLNQ